MIVDTERNIARFEQAYEKLSEELWLVRSLKAQGISYEQLAPHLKKDADQRMGIVRWITVPVFDGDTGEQT